MLMRIFRGSPLNIERSFLASYLSNHALHILSSFLVPGLNDPHSFACQLVSRLVLNGLDVNCRGEFGRTAVNHVGSACAHAPLAGGSIIPFLLIQYGADPCIPDDDGNLCVHSLIRQQQWRILQQITNHPADAGERGMYVPSSSSTSSSSLLSSSSSSTSPSLSLWQSQAVLRYQLLRRNNFGENAIECAARIWKNYPGSRDARATHEIMQRLQRTWMKGVRAQLQATLLEHIPVNVLADLCLQFCDGGGRKFQIEEQEEQ